MWQVRFDKSGYITAYSDWLPVPPPQIDIHIGMVQSTQPFVSNVQGYENGIEIEFDKYMQTSTITTVGVINVTHKANPTS